MKVLTAKYVEGFELLLEFDNGVKHTVDFAPFLNQSTNPLIRQYLNADRFQEFRITNGDLEWNDFDLVFPIIDLYNNDLMD